MGEWQTSLWPILESLLFEFRRWLRGETPSTEQENVVPLSAAIAGCGLMYLFSALRYLLVKLQIQRRIPFSEAYSPHSESPINANTPSPSRSERPSHPPCSGLSKADSWILSASCDVA